MPTPEFEKDDLTSTSSKVKVDPSLCKEQVQLMNAMVPSNTLDSWDEVHMPVVSFQETVFQWRHLLNWGAQLTDSVLSLFADSPIWTSVVQFLISKGTFKSWL